MFENCFFSHHLLFQCLTRPVPSTATSPPGIPEQWRTWTTVSCSDMFENCFFSHHLLFQCFSMHGPSTATSPTGRPGQWQTCTEVSCSDVWKLFLLSPPFSSVLQQRFQADLVRWSMAILTRRWQLFNIDRPFRVLFPRYIHEFVDINSVWCLPKWTIWVDCSERRHQLLCVSPQRHLFHLYNCCCQWVHRNIIMRHWLWQPRQRCDQRLRNSSSSTVHIHPTIVNPFVKARPSYTNMFPARRLLARRRMRVRR